MQTIRVYSSVEEDGSMGMNQAQKEKYQDRVFGEWLKKQREDKDLTLYELSEKTRIPLFRLAQLEAGQTKYGITNREAAKIAEFYCMIVDQVVSQALGAIH